MLTRTRKKGVRLFIVLLIGLLTAGAPTATSDAFAAGGSSGSGSGSLGG